MGDSKPVLSYDITDKRLGLPGTHILRNDVNTSFSMDFSSLRNKLPNEEYSMKFILLFIYT